jgi:hypothetical protein
MGGRSRKLITADKPTVIAKSFSNHIVVEDCESYRRLPDPPSADESDGFEAFSESNDLLNQLFTSETVPQRRRREFAKWDAMKM